MPAARNVGATGAKRLRFKRGLTACGGSTRDSGDPVNCASGASEEAPGIGWPQSARCGDHAPSSAQMRTRWKRKTALSGQLSPSRTSCLGTTLKLGLVVGSTLTRSWARPRGRPSRCHWRHQSDNDPQETKVRSATPLESTPASGARPVSDGKGVITSCLDNHRLRGLRRSSESSRLRPTRTSSGWAGTFAGSPATILASP